MSPSNMLEGYTQAELISLARERKRFNRSRADELRDVRAMAAAPLAAPQAATYSALELAKRSQSARGPARGLSHRGDFLVGDVATLQHFQASIRSATTKSKMAWLQNERLPPPLSQPATPNGPNAYHFHYTRAMRERNGVDAAAVLRTGNVY